MRAAHTSSPRNKAMNNAKSPLPSNSLCESTLGADVSLVSSSLPSPSVEETASGHSVPFCALNSGLHHDHDVPTSIYADSYYSSNNDDARVGLDTPDKNHSYSALASPESTFHAQQSQDIDQVPDITSSSFNAPFINPSPDMRFHPFFTSSRPEASYSDSYFNDETIVSVPRRSKRIRTSAFSQTLQMSPLHMTARLGVPDSAKRFNSSPTQSILQNAQSTPTMSELNFTPGGVK